MDIDAHKVLISGHWCTQSTNKEVFDQAYHDHPSCPLPLSFRCVLPWSSSICRAMFCFVQLWQLGAVMRVLVSPTLWASLSSTFLQTLPELVTPLSGHPLSPHSCPPTLSVPCERFGYYYVCGSNTASKRTHRHEVCSSRIKEDFCLDSNNFDSTNRGVN